ncbi:hypothetical protein [Pseudomonas psychrophila]|uniref:Uncharacterized protein n=1 Tax=Pseudomonas psychrophila TaxID=122355 RepID=A0A8I1FPL2_9PSED|nr:hypothetical protein [Pseudomonas psychrophila]MBJ2258337.1 hypothetical protein [Pseudomonas psychrophila]
MDELSKEAKRTLREGLKAYDKEIWDLISYSRDSDILKYDPAYITTNTDIHDKAIKCLNNLKQYLEQGKIEHRFLERAYQLGLRNLNKIVSNQPRSYVRWHLNNARCELLSEMRKDWGSCRINIIYIHPDA